MAKFHRVFVAEKPALAEHIALARAEQLGVRATLEKPSGYWDIGGTERVTWFFGHMFSVLLPREYARFANVGLDGLPIFLGKDEWRRKVTDDPQSRGVSKKDHVAKVAAMVRNAAIIVNAGDAEREGQLLVDEALIEFGIDPFGANVERIWIQSVTRKDVLAALLAMKPNAEKRHLFDAAWCRQRADWQHGMTYSTEYGIKARNAGADVTISVGRVQTPTLRLVVDRDRIRSNFKPVNHFKPSSVFHHQNGSFKARWEIPKSSDGLDSEDRLVDRKVADAVLARIAGKTGRIKAARSETKSESPPLPFSLSELQIECGGKLGLTADDTLKAAQELYMTHKAISYPRSDSRYLPTGILKDEAPGIMEALSKTPGLEAACGAGDLGRKSAAWDDKKISDHYGIIPTSEFSAAKLSRMSDTERAVFMLIARSFIAQFHAPYRYKALSVDVECEGENFRATGRQVVEPGWRADFGMGAARDEDESAGEAAQSLPQMSQGDPVKAGDGSVNPSVTKPPPPYTDPLLIKDMTSVHRLDCVTDPEIKKLLRENDGLGTEATRAATIELLLRREYLKRKGKVGLESTQLGQSVIDAVAAPLKDPALTALWEQQLEKVNAGTLDPEAFMDAQVRDMRKQVGSRRSEAIAVKGVRMVKPLEGHGVQCPRCSQGSMVTIEIHTGSRKGERYLRCSRPECKRAEAEPIEGDGKTCSKCRKGTMKTYIVEKEGSNKGKPYLRCTADGCKNFEFPDRGPDSAQDGPPPEPLPRHGAACPSCLKGRLETRRFSGKDSKVWTNLACRGGASGCEYSEWPVIGLDGRPMDPPEGHAVKCGKCRKAFMQAVVIKKEGSPSLGKVFLACGDRACDNKLWPGEPPPGPKLPDDGKKCPKCKKSKLETKTVRKEGPNQGKTFLSCSDRGCGFMVWPDDKPKGPPPPPAEGHGKKCPACGKGRLVTDAFKAKDGRPMVKLKCDKYPECQHSEWPPRPGESKAVGKDSRR